MALLQRGTVEREMLQAGTCAGLLRVTSHTATPFRRTGTQKLTLTASFSGLRLFTCRNGDQIEAGARKHFITWMETILTLRS
ncbi:rCG39273 [Rattus norvegicus]|uniref:RCG39273 n=1 Tax=Rattus norvegicus TaxID=10116 RepID=A6I9Y7_RAT|nr:rCG39273 [Rattus norvegicus]